MKKIFLLFLLFLFLSTSVLAAEIKGGYAACLTEELFDQITQAAVRKDERGWNYLIGNGCIIPKSGISVSILKTTWTGKAKVRAYVGNDTIILWTNIENINR
jgi:hypothetical protein